jgi:signal transduction histidine kinase
MSSFMLVEGIVCFDQNGVLLSKGYVTMVPAAFLSNSLAQTALQTNQPADDTINAGGSIGQVYRYAEVVRGPGGNSIIGVVMVCESIQVQQEVLSLLLVLTLIVGGVALVGAGLGGLFLAHRALVPARLAWARQQRFIADASHELRTPLTLLRADAEVLLRNREHLDVEDADLLEDIVAEAKHMANLADNMLTLARLDNPSSHQEQEVVNLTELVRGGARRIQALADQQQIGIQVETSDIAVVIGDRLLLEQATLALLDNAIKYNRPGGQITLRTMVKDDRALLEVSDTGIGIAAEHLSSLGERFYRVDKARSREAGGTGLGLSIVRHIAATHEGTLSLKSVSEQGTTVTLALPLARGVLQNRYVLSDRVSS